MNNGSNRQTDRDRYIQSRKITDQNQCFHWMIRFQVMIMIMMGLVFPYKRRIINWLAGADFPLLLLLFFFFWPLKINNNFHCFCFYAFTNYIFKQLTLSPRETVQRCSRDSVATSIYQTSIGIDIDQTSILDPNSKSEVKGDDPATCTPGTSDICMSGTPEHMHVGYTRT